MEENEFRKMSRRELLGVLLEQEKEIERLRAELETANAALADRSVRISKAGTLAEAVLSLNGVYADLEKSAEQYLENIRIRDEESKRKLAWAEKRAADMLIRAREEAERINAECGNAKQREPAASQQEKEFEATIERW